MDTTMVRCKRNVFGIYTCETTTIEKDALDNKQERENTELIPIPRAISWSPMFTRWYISWTYSFPSVYLYYKHK